jgi:1,4-alpha-glucan branching enzyme
VDRHNWEQSCISFLRTSPEGGDILVACNFTPVPRHNYLMGVPRSGYWREILNSDTPDYGGSGTGNFGGVDSAPVPAHGQFHSIMLILPPLSVVYLKGPEGGDLD